MRVLVKAWFDHRAWEAEVIAERQSENGTMLLVVADKGAAVWRNCDDCKPMLPFAR